MNKCPESWVKEWCQENGWTDLFVERRHYWAFPPGAVIPVPIPPQVIKTLRTQRGPSLEEKIWRIAAVLCTLGATILSYLFRSPMPLVTAFAFCAVTVARLEDDD